MQVAVANEAELSSRIEKFVRGNFKCPYTTIELKVGDCKFDVVGLNGHERCFYIVETKIGSKPTDVGHAFGQILAYEAVISQKGYEFVSEFIEKVHVKDVAALHDLFNEKRVPVNFFVGLTDKACNRYDMINNLKSKLHHVGIIRFKDRCKTYLRDNLRKKDSDICRSEQITINIERHFDRVAFLREVERKMKAEYQELTTSLHPTEHPRFVQFRFGHSPFHLEALFSKGVLSLSMDIEPAKKEHKERFFDYVEKKAPHLPKKIRGLVIERNWINRGKWGRLVVTIKPPVLNDDLVDQSVEKLAQIYEALKPLVEDFSRNHGRYLQ